VFFGYGYDLVSTKEDIRAAAQWEPTVARRLPHVLWLPWVVDRRMADGAESYSWKRLLTAQANASRSSGNQAIQAPNICNVVAPLEDSSSSTTIVERHRS
jgi:hypothetical protein